MTLTFAQLHVRSLVLSSSCPLSLSQSDSLITVVVVDPLQSAANASVGSENEIENITRKITENVCEK